MFSSSSSILFNLFHNLCCSFDIGLWLQMAKPDLNRDLENTLIKIKNSVLKLVIVREKLFQKQPQIFATWKTWNTYPIIQPSGVISYVVTYLPSIPAGGSDEIQAHSHSVSSWGRGGNFRSKERLTREKQQQQQKTAKGPPHPGWDPSLPSWKFLLAIQPWWQEPIWTNLRNAIHVSSSPRTVGATGGATSPLRGAAGPG